MSSIRKAAQVFVTIIFLSIAAVNSGTAAPVEKWSEQKAKEWYGKQPWLIGSNYNPASAINELEMWQADSFDPKRIDLELGWAESLGMNTMRVYLHDLLWQQDAEGFKQRLDTFLTIAAKHGIRPSLRLVRFVLGSRPASGQATSPAPRRTQLGLGAKPRSDCAARRARVSAARSLCERRRRRTRS